MGADRTVPVDTADFAGLTHGADYYGRGGHREDFDFLLKNERRTTLEAIASRALCGVGMTEEESLRAIIGRLAGLGMMRRGGSNNR